MHERMPKRFLTVLLLLLLCFAAETAFAAAESATPIAAQTAEHAADALTGPDRDPLNWMNYLPDSISLGLINIPGTHDSSTNRLSFGSGKCQYVDVNTQLTYGVRFLDLRVGVRHDGSWNSKYEFWRKKPTKYWLEIYHGDSRAYYFFDTILDWCRDFLRAHPSETIIICVKEDPDTPYYFQKKTPDLVMEAYNKYKDFMYIDGSRIPTLGEVRGKMVLMRRYSAEGWKAVGVNARSGWPGDSYNYWDVPNTNPAFKMYVQDCYKFGTADWDKKWETFKTGFDTIAKHASEGANALYINHGSGYTSPYVVEGVADYVNPRIQTLYEKIRGNGHARGIVPMDCIKDGHARAVYMANRYSRYVNVTLKLNGNAYPNDTPLRLYDPIQKSFFFPEKLGGGRYCYIAPSESTSQAEVYLNDRKIDAFALTSVQTAKEYNLYKIEYKLRENSEEAGTVPLDDRLYLGTDTVEIARTANIYHAPGSTDFLLGFSTDKNATVPMRSLKPQEQTTWTLYAVWTRGIGGSIDISDSSVRGLWLKEEGGKQYSTDGENWAPYPDTEQIVSLTGSNPAFRCYVLSGTHYLLLNNVSVASNATESGEAYRASLTRAQSDGQIMAQAQSDGQVSHLAGTSPIGVFGSGILYVAEGATADVSLAADSDNSLQLLSTLTPSTLHAAIQVDGSLSIHAADASEGGKAVGKLTVAADNGGAGVSIGENAASASGALLHIQSGRISVTSRTNSAAIGKSALCGHTQNGAVHISGGTVTANGGSGAAYAIGGGANDAIAVTIDGGSVTTNGNGVQTPKNSEGKALVCATMTAPERDARQALQAFTPSYYQAADVYSNGSGQLHFYIPEGLSSFYYNRSDANKGYYFVMAKEGESNAYTKAKLTVDSINKRIFANGETITVAAVGGKTIIKDNLGVSQVLMDIAGDPATGYDLSAYDLFGGSDRINASTSSRIIMAGGAVRSLFGGGCKGDIPGTSIEMQGGNVERLFACGLGAGKIEPGSAQIKISGGTVTEGVYAVYNGEQQIAGGSPVLVSLWGNPDLSDADIRGVYDGGASTVGMQVKIGEDGGLIAPLTLGNIDMTNLSGSERSVALTNSAHVTLNGIDPLTNVHTLSVPDGCCLELDNIAADVPELQSFTGGGTLELAAGMYIQADTIGAANPTHVLPGDTEKDALLFKAPASAPEDAFYVNPPLRSVKLPDGSFILTTLAVSGDTIYAGGTGILIKQGALAGRSLVCFAADPDTPLPLTGITGDTTEGYDLTNVRIFAGGNGRDGGTGPYGDASVTMTGGRVGTLYAGGDASTGSSGAIAILGGSVDTVYLGGKNGDDMRGSCSLVMSDGAIDTLYVGGDGGTVGESSASDTPGAHAQILGGSVNRVYVGDKGNGTVRNGARLELGSSETAALLPVAPSIAGANGTSVRRVILHGFGQGDATAECPAIQDIDDVVLLAGTNVRVRTSARFHNVDALSILEGSSLTVDCGDLSVGALVGEESEGNDGMLEYVRPGLSMQVTGAVEGLLFLLPAEDAEAGDVMLRAAGADEDNFELLNDDFLLEKRGDTLVLVKRPVPPTPAPAPHESSASAAPTYRLLSGGGRWMHGSRTGLPFTFNASASRVFRVEADGTALPPDAYDLADRTLTIKEAFLNELALGMHTLRIVFSDGALSARFEVYAGVSGVPATGGSVAGSLCILSVWLCVEAARLLRRERRRLSFAALRFPVAEDRILS